MLWCHNSCIRGMQTDQASRDALHLRTAQENGDFAEAFWLCAQCKESIKSLRQLHVSAQLTQTIQDLHDDTTLRLHTALQVSCTEFRPEPYSKVRFSILHVCNLPCLLCRANRIYAINCSVAHLLNTKLADQPSNPEDNRKTAITTC